MKLMRADRSGSRPPPRRHRPRAPVRDVVPDGAREEECLLRNVAELMAEVVQIDGAQVVPVDLNAPLIGS